MVDYKKVNQFDFTDAMKLREGRPTQKTHAKVRKGFPVGTCKR